MNIRRSYRVEISLMKRYWRTIINVWRWGTVLRYRLERRCHRRCWLLTERYSICNRGTVIKL